MKNFNLLHFIFYFLFMIITACTNTPVKEKTIQDNTVVKKEDRHKPPATYQDTLTIDFPAAIFYHPDSLQLLKIKELTDPMIYDGSMHEYFYLMRNAHAALKSFHPGLKIIEAKNKRYLLFIKSDSATDCIDLNTKDDAYGLFVFDGKKSPGYLDMANIDRGLWFYFSENKRDSLKK